MYATERRSTRGKALGILAAGAIVLGSLGVARVDAQQIVSWTNQANVTARGNVLEKVGGCQGCEDAGAVSRQTIHGDGFAEWTVGEPYSFMMVGLSQPNGNLTFNGIDFGVRFNGNGGADVLESGVYQSGSDIDYWQGDRFRVAVVNGRVQYSKNGQVFYESRRSARFPLALATSLGTVGATVRNARIDADARAVTSNDQGYTGGDRVATLDRNRDGVIERWEWRGNRGEFNQLDVNRDGVLSRRELARADDYGSAVGTSGQLVVVDARQAWTDTGIWVEAGDLVTVDADGRVQLSDNPSDVASPAGAQSGRRAANAPLPAQPAGALIARIEDGGATVVGAHRTMRAPRSGELFLGINDDHMPDNNGRFRVTVTVEPR